MNSSCLFILLVTVLGNADGGLVLHVGNLNISDAVDEVIKLRLRENKITEIRPHTFDGMNKLEVIDLGENELTKVVSKAFVGAINLKSLDLRRNKINTIEDGAFNLPALEEINLSDNKLETLTNDVFVGCPELKVVYLDGNELTRIGKSIDNVPKLAWLFFHNDGVRIVDFDFYAIARKPHLEYFVAVNVSLVLDDPPSAAHDNYTAKRLYITGNNLSSPDILHRLRNFRNLIVLNISYNNFTTIDDIENILEMFPKLQTLIITDLPCKDEVILRLRTKFGDKIDSIDSSHVYFL